MTDLHDDERRLGERQAALGPAELLATLPPRGTISPRTLAAARSRVSALAKTAAASSEVSPTRTSRLPHISLDFRLSNASDIDLTADGSSADFAILRTLGEGGMGRVHLAVQRSLGREVAIKTLKGEGSSGYGGELLEEARITGALEHPGIIPVHVLGLDDDGRPLLVMKRVEGTSLSALLEEPEHPAWKPLTAGGADWIEAAVGVLMRVCQALSFAHSRGVLHRDIKPDNIMVGNYGEIYLVDWGVAANLKDLAGPTEMISGTPAYMAPEMVLGDALDERADIYLLGATLHEILTGRARHEGETLEDVFRSATNSVPVVYSASVPADLAEICNRATARDRARRPESADAFRVELEGYLQRRGAIALSDAASERVAALEAALREAPADAPPADLAHAYRLAAEARFGFAQSLREAPSFEAARRGLVRCILAQVDLELRQDHAETAAALLAEIEAPPRSFLARVDMARAKAEEARREAARLQAIDRDLDPSVSATARTVALFILAMMLSAIAFVIIFVPTVRSALTTGGMFQVSIVLFLALSVGVFFFRQRLLANLFNRRVAATILIGLGGMIVHRAFAVVRGDSVRTVITDDLLLLAISFAMAAGTFEGWFALPAVGLLGGRVIVEIFPEHAATVFGTMGIVIAIFTLIALQRRARSRQADN